MHPIIAVLPVVPTSGGQNPDLGFPLCLSPISKEQKEAKEVNSCHKGKIFSHEWKRIPANEHETFSHVSRFYAVLRKVR